MPYINQSFCADPGDLFKYVASMGSVPRQTSMDRDDKDKTSTWST
jgi:hypothetical protein